MVVHVGRYVYIVHQLVVERVRTKTSITSIIYYYFCSFVVEATQPQVFLCELSSVVEDQHHLRSTSITLLASRARLAKAGVGSLFL